VRVEDGTIAEARIAVGSVGARPVRATSAAQALVGKPVRDAGVLAEAAALAAEAAEAVEDANGSVEYKQQLVRVLVERCFRDAASATAPDTH
jgi:aerobic carbon-monoxide dehydrogenase medium subunit